jgi:hypothetical protein
MMGGADGKLEPDPAAIADIEAVEDASATHWATQRAVPNMEILVGHLAALIVINANANGLCIAAMAAQIIEHLAKMAREQLDPAIAEDQRTHLLDEIETMCAAIRRGDV